MEHPCALADRAVSGLYSRREATAAREIQQKSATLGTPMERERDRLHICVGADHASGLQTGQSAGGTMPHESAALATPWKGRETEEDRLYVCLCVSPSGACVRICRQGSQRVVQQYGGNCSKGDAAGVGDTGNAHGKLAVVWVRFGGDGEEGVGVDAAAYETLIKDDAKDKPLERQEPQRKVQQQQDEICGLQGCKGEQLCYAHKCH
eukprot:CAMPEP_0177665704 /NCGR_PEP_ID=MMETSP0447-20121125/21197_1 /TAXON_ID=0 /ORGANISM="Stygamoeba regulata, Strain BSH-02190019" /LENGTH=206 /DNA_ID=CAMNT_0019171817 /DNA_START=63 /DNA_END=683 /DNA_ORIENTATION=+